MQLCILVKHWLPLRDVREAPVEQFLTSFSSAVKRRTTIEISVSAASFSASSWRGRRARYQPYELHWQSYEQQELRCLSPFIGIGAT